MPQIKYINLADLNLPKFQAHKNVDQNHIKEISESIKLLGVIEPLIIRDTHDGPEIVAGCVRYQASLLAGLKAVPCIIMQLDHKSAEILKLHENIKRIPLDHVDQGETFIMMMEDFEMTTDQVSQSIGRSIPYVSQHISLVKIDNEITKAVKENRISFSQSRELIRIKDKSERLRLLKFCQNDGATVEVLQRWVNEFLRNSQPEPAPESKTEDPKYDYNDPHLARSCEACGKSTEISTIRQVFYCPNCHQSIKTAISEERRNLPQNST